MSELKVNKITPKTGTSIQLGESGDTITIPCGATLTNNGTATGFGLSFCTTVTTSPFTATANECFFINTGSAVTVTLTITDSGSTVYNVIKGAPIPVGGSLELIDGGSKVVLQSGDSVEALSNTASAVDVILSVVDSIST